VVTIGSDDCILSRHASLTADANSFLTISQMAETSNLTLLVKQVSKNFETTANQHIFPILAKLLLCYRAFMWQVCNF